MLKSKHTSIRAVSQFKNELMGEYSWLRDPESGLSFPLCKCCFDGESFANFLENSNKLNY